jgi:hypothetical protein
VAVASSGCGITWTWNPPQHKEVTYLCPVSGGFAVKSYEAAVSFFGITSDQTFTCGSGAFIPVTAGHPGQSWVFTCTSPSPQATSTETVTLKGHQTLVVGGQSVNAIDVTVSAQITGGGNESAEYWLAPNGTIVEENASINSTRNGYAYTSQAHLMLLSLRPA